MNRGSFLKGLFGGAIALAAIPSSANIVKKQSDVKKLTDEQLNELYKAYIDLQNKKKKDEEKAHKLYKNSLIEIEKQYEILSSMNFIYSIFHKKKKVNVTKLYVKKHIKKLENYIKWLEIYFHENPNKYYTGSTRNMRDMDYIIKSDVTIGIIKGYLLIGEIKTANSLFEQFSMDRNYGVRNTHIDDYALIYFGDLYYKAGYKKEAIEWYNQSDKDRIIRWVKKLEENPNRNEVQIEFNKRYYSKAYFGYMIYDKDNINIKSCSNYRELIRKYEKIKNGKMKFDIDEWI